MTQRRIKTDRSWVWASLDPTHQIGTPPLLIFGGPYSNLRATLAMRARAVELGIPPASCICTGDVVAYCTEPEETTAAIRDWGCHVIAGNCEEQLAAAAVDCACGFEEGSECDRLAKGWYPFANARLSRESRAWMAAVPKTLAFALGGLSFRVIHGGVDVINRFIFASERGVLAEEVERSGADVVIAGHAGVPFIKKVGRRVWFNPGVIGMPANDGTADVWYGLIGINGGRIVLSTHRLSYDHLAAAAAVRREGHADGYARTLITGLWPSLDVFPPPERAATAKRLRPRALRVEMQSVPARVQLAKRICTNCSMRHTRPIGLLGRPMPNYRRAFVAGGCWFFTVNLLDRSSRLLVDHIGALREAVRVTRQDFPFQIDAMVVLPDHIHAVWTLPEDDSNFSVRWRLIKIRFSRSIPRGERLNESRRARGERGIWQRRFWEHLIRDDCDCRHHIDYCWFNPVKHGLVANVEDWPFSSFHRDMRDHDAPARFEDFERTLAEYARKGRTSAYGER